MTVYTDKEWAFVTAMRDVVREAGPDHYYDQGETEGQPTDTDCTYINWRDMKEGVEPVGSCLIGRALLRSGLVSADYLMYVEGKDAESAIPFEKGAVTRAANTAQGHQDHGETWGYAYDEFVDELANAGYDTSSLRL